jgi:deoxyribonucleoside regulator
MDTDSLAFLAEVASLYYEEQLPQSEIGERIGRSRSMVSRLLREAREQGLVEIRIRHPLKTDAYLEEQLIGRCALKAVRVLADPPQDYRLLLQRLGALGAQALRRHLRSGVCVALGWGTAVHAVVRALPAVPLQRATVVQMIGALGSGDPVVDGPELAHWLAQKLNAKYRFLHAPLIVDNQRVARSLCQQQSIAKTLEMAAGADAALVGIGTVAPELSSLRRAGYVDERQLAEMSRRGVVGDLLARQINAAGQLVDAALNRRVIGLDLKALRAIGCVMAVAGGKAKQAAIVAAVKGGHINALITDADSARAVLESYEVPHDAHE